MLRVGERPTPGLTFHTLTHSPDFGRISLGRTKVRAQAIHVDVTIKSATIELKLLSNKSPQIPKHIFKIYFQNYSEHNSTNQLAIRSLVPTLLHYQWHEGCPTQQNPVQRVVASPAILGLGTEANIMPEDRYSHHLGNKLPYIHWGQDKRMPGQERGHLHCKKFWSSFSRVAPEPPLHVAIAS